MDQIHLQSDHWFLPVPFFKGYPWSSPLFPCLPRGNQLTGYVACCQVRRCGLPQSIVFFLSWILHPRRNTSLINIIGLVIEHPSRSKRCYECSQRIIAIVIRESEIICLTQICEKCGDRHEYCSAHFTLHPQPPFSHSDSPSAPNLNFPLRLSIHNSLLLRLQVLQKPRNREFGSDSRHRFIPYRTVSVPLSANFLQILCITVLVAYTIRIRDKSSGTK